MLKSLFNKVAVLKVYFEDYQQTTTSVDLSHRLWLTLLIKMKLLK